MNSLEGARVALLACGCYNPPTIMHLRMFESARDFLEVRYGCEVVEGILSPVADYFGKPDLLPAMHRYKMSELAVKSSTWIRADQWECTQQQWTRTLLVLVHFKKMLDRKYNDTRLRLMLLCGGDVVDSFKRITPSGDYLWDPSDIGAIIRDFGLVVLARQNAEPMKTLSQLGYNGPSLANVFVFEDTALPNDISSTRLRAAIRRGESIKYCTTDSVVEYIRKHQLYRVKNNQSSNCLRRQKVHWSQRCMWDCAVNTMEEEDEFVSNLVEQGVPTAEVMEDVGAYLKKEGNISIEEGIKRLEAIYRKYKQVEQQLTEQKLRLVSKLPDLKKSVEVVNHLEEKSKKSEALEVTHLLSDHVYQRVKTDSLDKVLLWLGSNVMVEFNLSEARRILEDNYKSASDGVTKYDRELAFLKDQITTTEVNMAHVYNYGIRQRTGR